MSPSLQKSSFGLVVLFTIFYIVPFTTALPRGLRPRQTQLPEFLSFVPDCARKCTLEIITEKNCQGDRGCLCGNSQSFRNLVWSCIDGNCGGQSSQVHKDSEASVVGLCKGPGSTTASATVTSTSPASSQTASTTTPGSTATTSAGSSSLGSPQTASPIAQTSTTSVAEDTALPTATAAFVDSSEDATPSGNADAAKDDNIVLSTPAIIGISIGSFCLLAAVVGACVFCVCRKNHRKQAQSLEPHSPRGGAAIGGGKESIGYGGWISIDHSTNTGGYYSNHGVPPINTNVANEKPNANLGLNISPVSPVSPIVPQGFEFGDSVQQQGKIFGSQKIMENPHNFMPPAVIYTPASPIGSVDRTSDSVILPSPAQDRVHSPNFAVHSYNGYPGIAISTDSPEASSTPSNRHTCSPNTMRRPDHPSDPLISSASPPEYTSSPISESSASTRSSVHSSHGPSAVGISRSDTLAWRRELDEAAGRALTRVLRSEQSINEEMDAAKRRKSSIPGLDRFSRRLSRDHRADEENSLVGGERSSGFWGGFGSKNSRTSSSRNSGFMNRRSNSGASGGSSKRSIILERGGGIV